MIVVSDTSPLNYLILLHADQHMPAVLGEVVAPPAVLEELRTWGASEPVRQWAANPPAWLRLIQPATIDASLSLGAGESAAISLAVELRRADPSVRLLIDEKAGRAAARRLGLPLLGTLTVLGEAGRMRLIDLPEALSRLKQTSFHAKPELYDEVLRLYGCGPGS
jgi:predicted nucleic acid-binding protein